MPKLRHVEDLMRAEVDSSHDLIARSRTIRSDSQRLIASSQKLIQKVMLKLYRSRVVRRESGQQGSGDA